MGYQGQGVLGRSAAQTTSMLWLQRATLKNTRACRLKMGLRQVCT